MLCGEVFIFNSIKGSKKQRRAGVEAACPARGQSCKWLESHHMDGDTWSQSGRQAAAGWAMDLVTGSPVQGTSGYVNRNRDTMNTQSKPDSRRYIGSLLSAQEPLR